MKLLPILSAIAATAAHPQQIPLGSPPQYPFTNPPSDLPSTHRIPTSYESAVLARRILALTPLGTLATVFPSTSSAADDDDDDAAALERRPPGLAGVPISLMDYIADCEDAGNPTILAITIATSFRNVRAGSNISLSLRWTPPYKPDGRIRSAADAPSSPLLSALRWLGLARPTAATAAAPPDVVPYSAANLPRFSLLGYLEPIALPAAEDDIDETPLADRSDAPLASCFVAQHPDARYWLPGNRIHASEWVRLVVTDVYWIGGFGDRAYIGWIPVGEWRNVTRAEWEEARLPGEKKGWDEWSHDGDL